MTDSLHKYLSADRSTRIQAVKLTRAWQTGLAHQDLPGSVTQLLGELSAACVLLASSLKFDGSVVLQLQGHGPVRLIMVECTSNMQLRATAQLQEDASLPQHADLQTLLNADGRGHFMVMLDPHQRPLGVQPYQGIVPLEGATVAAVLEDYMRHSEQLDTRLWLAADQNCCAGFLLQRMPAKADASGLAQEPEQALQTWQHCLTLASTIKPAELLAIEPEAMVQRLFWQDDILVFTPRQVSWHCPCSKQRVVDMIRRLGHDEVNDILAEQGQLQVTCNFCGKPYTFDPVDCAAIFIENPQSLADANPNTRH